MTVAECLKKWLKGFRAYDLTDVLTDIIDLDDGTFSIAKSPNSTVLREFQDGSSLVSEYYQFYASGSSGDDEDRNENHEFLQIFGNWIEDRNFLGKFPDLSKAGPLSCQEVKVNSSGEFSVEEGGRNTIYQVVLEVTFLKRR